MQLLYDLNDVSARRRTTTLFPNPQPVFAGVQESFVNTSTGALTFLVRDLVRIGGMPIVMGRVYDSTLDKGADFGPGWKLTVEEEVRQDGSRLLFTDASNGVHRLDVSGGTVVPASPATAPVVSGSMRTTGAEAGIVVLKSADGMLRRFKQAGDVWRLVHVRHDRGWVRFGWRRGSLFEVTSDTGWVRIARRDDGRISSIVDDVGRTVTYSYGSDGRLAGVVDLAGGHWRMDYAGAGRISSITDPRTKVVLAATWTDARVRRIRALHETTDFAYAESTTTATNLLGWTTVYRRTNSGITTSITDRTGVTTELVFDAGHRPVAAKRDSAVIARIGYDGEGRLATLWQPAGDTAFTTNDRGEVTGATGAWTARYRYAGRRVVHATDGGGVRDYRYTEDGRLAGVTVDGIDTTLDTNADRPTGVPWSASPTRRDRHHAGHQRRRNPGRDVPGRASAGHLHLRCRRAGVVDRLRRGRDRDVRLRLARSEDIRGLRLRDGPADRRGDLVRRGGQPDPHRARRGGRRNNGADIRDRRLQRGAAGAHGRRLGPGQAGPPVQVRRVRARAAGDARPAHGDGRIRRPGPRNPRRRGRRHGARVRLRAGRRGRGATGGPAHGRRAGRGGPFAGVRDDGVRRVRAAAFLGVRHRRLLAGAEDLRGPARRARGDGLLLESLHARMVPLAGGEPNPAPYGHDKPSNSLFIPPEFRAVNCHLCTGFVYGIDLDVTPAGANCPTKYAAVVDGYCHTLIAGDFVPIGLEIPLPWHHFTDFGDGSSNSETTWHTEVSGTHRYKKAGEFTMSHFAVCSCPSAFAFGDTSVTFNVPGGNASCPTVRVDSADVVSDEIVVTLQPAGVSGTLVVSSLMDRGAPHTVNTRTATGGTHTIAFGVESLPTGDYTGVRATWTVGTNTPSDTRPYSFQVLGNYLHSQYNTPSEASCTGAPRRSYVTNNQCTFTGTTLKSDFAKQVNLNGSGYSTHHGTVACEEWCLDNAEHPDDADGRSFRSGHTITGSCGGVSSATVAVHPKHDHLSCGDRVYIVGLGVKTVTDLCPGCLMQSQLDNYTTSTACHGISNLGTLKTIKL